MQDKRVLVTGAGGPAGITVVRELAGREIFTLACDINPYGAGLFLGSAAALVPPYTDPDYLEALLGLCREHGINGLISTMTEELSVLSEPANLAQLRDAGISFWFPPKAAVDACLDKVAFARVTEAAGQPVPRTASGDVDAALAVVPGPWIVKPAFGRGSRDIYPADDPARVREVWPNVPEPILQTRLSGQEFTIDALVDHGGALIGAVPRMRLETKAGISTTGRTFDAPGLFELTADFLASLGHRGPANIQGFIDETGGIAFTEVNPRFSGALALSLAAGADLVGQYLAGMYGQPMDRAALAFRPGTVMVRYFQEVILAQEPVALPPLHPIYPTDPTDGGAQA